MSIKARLLILITVLVALAFAVTGVATVTVTRAQMIGRVDALPDDRRPTRVLTAPPRWLARTTLTASNNYSPESCSLHRGNTRSSPSGFADDPDPLPDLSSYDASELDARRRVTRSPRRVDGSDLHYRTLSAMTGRAFTVTGRAAQWR